MDYFVHTHMSPARTRYDVLVLHGVTYCRTGVTDTYVTISSAVIDLVQGTFLAGCYAQMWWGGIYMNTMRE